VLTGLFQAPHSPLNVPITPQRRFSTAAIDVDRLTKLAIATETSVNDVVLALCSAALRRYLLDLNALPRQPLVAMCPVSVRPADSPSEGNAVSMILANLATHEPDPRRRLAAISASTRAAKAHLRSQPKAVLDCYSPLAMGPHLARQLVPGIASGMRPVFNVVISNVPGPPQPLHAGEARMEELYPMSLLFKNEALNITVCSYAGRLNFGFTACRSSLPHVQDLALHTLAALDELERAVVADQVGVSPATVVSQP
jgi:WS/DGAT/MGAT family acyltransferase